MAKLTLNNISNIFTAATEINTNFDRIEAAVENTLSRDGTSPNAMNADLDMNNNRIYNLPEPTTAGEPARKSDLDDLVAASASGFIANQAEAEAGIDNLKLMSPLRVAQAITAQIPDFPDDYTFASQAQAEDGLDNNTLMSPLRAKQATTVNAELGTFTPSGSGTASRTLRAKVRESLSFPDYASVAQALTAAGGTKVIRAPAGVHAVGGSNLDIGLGIIEADSGASFTGGGFVLPSGLTYASSERFGKKFANTSIDAYSIYGQIFPDVTYYDVLQSIAYLPAGADLVSHISAIAGYIRVDDAISSIGNNAVALFGGGVVTVDSGAGWGLNVLLQDALTRTAHSGTGRILLGAELDFNVMSPNTQVIGVSVGGNSLAQPTNASAFIVNTLNSVSKYKWTTGFASFDECAGNAFYMGLKEAGVNKPSQDFLTAYTDGSGVKQNLVMRTEGGFWHFVNGSLSVGSGNILLSSGHSLIVNGQAVVGARKTGWVASSGTIFRGAGFDADYYQTISGSYSQAQVQAIMDQLRLTARRVISLETDLRAHGLIT